MQARWSDLLRRGPSTPRAIVVWLALGGCGSPSSTATAALPAIPPAPAPTTTGAPDLPSGPYAPIGIDLQDCDVTGLAFVDDRRAVLSVARRLGDYLGQRPTRCRSEGVWVSDDGGDHWKARDGVSDGWGVSVGSGRVWVAGHGESCLWSSHDRGESFVPVARRDGCEDGHIPLHLAFSANVIAATTFADHVTTSRDDGATWQSGLDGYAKAANLAMVGDEVWAVGEDVVAGEGSKGATLFRSGDHGATWSTTLLRDEAHDLAGGALTCIAPVSADEVWVAGRSRQLFHTTSRGGTWTQAKHLPAEVDALLALFVSGRRVVTCAKLARDDGYALLVSDDGGATFELAEQRRCSARNAFGESCVPRGVASPRPGVYFVYGAGEVLDRFVRPERG